MEFNFSVDKPKKIKREEGMGEDAMPISKEGILVICDGTGATGQSKHFYNGAEYTSAYLGSRKTSELTDVFLSENYEKIINAVNSPDELKTIFTQLGDELRKGLCGFVEENDFKLTVRGKCFKLLPTTLAAAVYKIYEDHVDVVAISAGDSRVLLWEPEEGLHQLSLDDVEAGYDAFSDVSNINNCISADNEFRINYAVHSIPTTKCVLLATSDGFTDPIKPFEQERYLIQWIGNCGCVLNAEESKLRDYIGEALDKDVAGFTGKDDCSIAGTIIGYDSDEALKNSLRARFAYVKDTFTIPFFDINAKYREAMNEYNSTGTAARRHTEQTNSRIRERLLESAYVLLPSNYASNQAVADFLAAQPAINAETIKLNVECEEKKKRVQERLDQLNKDLFQSFVNICKQSAFNAFKTNNYGNLAPEIIDHIKNIANSNASKTTAYGSYNNVLRKFKNLPEVNTNNVPTVGVDEIKAMSDEIVQLSSEIERVNSSIEESERVVNSFYSCDNVQMEDLFNQQKNNNFYNLEKFVENLKTHKIGFWRSKDDDADYNLFRRMKNELDSIMHSYRRTQAEFESVNISDEEKIQRYKAVIRNNLNEIVKAIMANTTVFPFFAGETKEAYDAKILTGEQALDKAKSFIELKNGLWLKYKGQYESFVIAEKDYVVVPKKSEG